MKKRTILSMILLLTVIMASLSVIGLVIYAVQNDDAMTEIEAEFSEQKIGETIRVDDGYIGIPIEISTYYDTSNGDIVNGINGTPLIFYVVNTQVERIGTDSDTDIISSMLERGYVVAVFDYLNNAKAKSPALDYSIQTIREQIERKDLLANDVFPKGYYHHIYTVPAGYDILVEDVFFEIDKHGAAGSLEKIVENWNTDLKGCRSNTVIPWIYNNGSRKTVATASDGSEPIWYSDSAGKVVDNENGIYTKIKWTVATDVTDCVNPDGTPIDLDLYITVTYPTHPEKKAPIMTYNSCQGTLPVAANDTGQAHVPGFLFNGYVGVMYDHLWIPMARNVSYDYYDGNDAGGVTGNGLSYSLQYYNNNEINTAAMRYLRYLALSDPETYKFDGDHIGIFGYSKGGWMLSIGEAVLQKPLVSNPEDYDSKEALEIAITKKLSALYDKWVHEGHYGETRFEAGQTESYTKNGVTIDGGTVQPWLTFNGQEIISGAQLIYPCVGSSPEDISDGHTAVFTTNNVLDGPNGGYHTMNMVANACKNHNVPTMFFEVNIAHALTYGPDAFHGVDTYQAFFDFAGYYIKGDAVKVVWISPKALAADVEISEEITLKFTGAVSADEITKVKVTTENGTVLNGSWSSVYGDTEWTFTPHDMKGGTTYTVTVPADIKGDNGKEMGSVFERTFSTKIDEAASASSVVRVDGGSYVTFTVPQMAVGANRYFFRFRVENDAANIAELYEVKSFNSSAPASSTLGAFLGKVNLKGEGIYEIDITDYIAPYAGQSITLFVKESKSAGVFEVTRNGFENGTSAVRGNKYVSHSLVTDPLGASNVLKAVIRDIGNPLYNYYSSPATVFYYDNIIKSTNLEASDYGRKFTVSFKVYDATSRNLQIELTKCTDLAYETIDYQYPIYNLRTVAGEWTTLSFDYTVYDMEYGNKGTSIKKVLTVSAMSDGSNKTPLYFDDIVVTETVTGIEMTDFSIASKADCGADYKAPMGDKVFTVYSGNNAVASYNSFKTMLSEYVSGYTVKLNSNYTFTDSDVFDGLCGIENLIIDLNGYTVNCENTVYSLLYVKNASATSFITSVKITNGGINIGKTPLISYEDSGTFGVGKQLDFKFENVAFGVINGATARTYFSDTNINKGAYTEIKITADYCTFDISDSKIPYTSLVILSAGTDDLSVSYELTSPVFKFTSQKWVKILKDTKCAVFNKGSDGKYATLILNVAESPWNTAYAMSDANGIFSSREEKNGYAFYYLTESELATSYGMIPEQYASVEEYPWIVFDTDGNVIRATKLFAQDNEASALSTVANRYIGTWYIFLRRDFEYNEPRFNNLGFTMGDVYIDLNGKTITCKSNIEIFNASAKAGSYANFYIKNGTFVSGNGFAFMRFGGHTTGSYDGSEAKIMHFIFDDVTFKASSQTSTLFTTSTPSINVVGNLTFNDCTFDLTDAPSGFKLFDIYDSTERLTSAVNINGGTFKSDTFDGITLYGAMNSKGSIKFGKNDDGKYPSAVTTATGAFAPSDNIPTDEGNKIYSNGETEFGVTTYSLTDNIYLTKYGTIPVQYSDANVYPFLLFHDGVFHSAYTCFIEGNTSNPNGVMAQGAKENVWKGGMWTILMRANHTIQTGGWNNLSQLNGVINIDLDGNVLTTSANSSLFVANKKSAHNTTINVKNGTILLNSPLVSFGQGDSGAGKIMSVSFEDVKIGLAAGSNVTKIVETFNNTLSKGKVVKSDLRFTNCDFDFKTNAPANKINFISLTGDPDCHKTDVVFEGGSVTVGANGISFLSLDNSNRVNAKDTAVFRPYNGEFITFITPSGTSAPSNWFDSDDGQVKFYLLSEENSEKIYILANLESPYGTIDPKYADADKYPFVVFTYDDASKSVKCVAGFPCWADVNNGGMGNPYGALVCAKDNAWRKGGAIILLRRDYDIQTGGYNNLCHANGTITLDLNGHMLVGGNSILFAATNKKSHNTTIITKNGTILLESAELVTLMAADSGNGSKFSFTFENVTIGFAKNATITRIIETFNATVAASTVCSAEINFINCLMDLRTNAPAGEIKLFNGVNDNGHHKAAVIIKGGSIIAGNVKLYNVDNAVNANAPDSFLFAKNESGSYTTLKLLTGVNAPDAAFNTPDGDMVFVKQGEDGDNVIYTLESNALKIVSAFLNLTSDINVYFRINAPAVYENPYMEFIFNGKTYTVTEYFIDENGRYCFAFKDIAPQYMGEIIEATLYATKNGTLVSVSNNSYSILSYCKSLLENYASNEKLVTLVSDLLVYGAKAQVYAGNTEALVTEGLELRASVFTELDKNSDKIALSGDASELVAWKSVGMYLENDMSLKLSFTADSTEGLTVEITVKGHVSVIDASELIPDENGVYSIYFDGILATDFDESVTAVFKLNGEHYGYTLTYSANSYVYRMQNSDNVATKELVRALCNYGKSANAYLG